MQAINVADLTRDKNMKKSHFFKVGQKVNLNYTDEQLSYIDMKQTHVDAIKNKSPFYIVNCDRDCDGTPLYSLSTIPFKLNDGKSPDLSLIDYMIGKEKLSSVDDAFLAHKFISSILLTGISEDDIDFFVAGDTDIKLYMEERGFIFVESEEEYKQLFLMEGDQVAYEALNEPDSYPCYCKPERVIENPNGENYYLTNNVSI